MRDHHPQLQRPRRLEPRGDAADLLHRHLAVGMPVRVRRVHAEHQQVAGFERRLECLAERPLMIAIRIEQPRQRIEERNVVITRHDDHRRDAERIKKRTRRSELMLPRTLRDVAGHDDEIGRQRIDQAQERGDDHRPFGTEMGIGNLQQQAHERLASATAGSGLSSSGWSETRNCSGTSSRITSQSVAIFAQRRFFDGCVTVMRSKLKLVT